MLVDLKGSLYKIQHGNLAGCTPTYPWRPTEAPTRITLNQDLWFLCEPGKQ